MDKSKSHDRGHKQGEGKSTEKHKRTSSGQQPTHKGRHDNKGRDGSHTDKDKGLGKGTHDNKGRHDSKNGKASPSDSRRSEHTGYPRLQGIGGRYDKGFDSKQIARYNGERHYHADPVVDKHYHEKYGHQFRYYCGDHYCHGWWYLGLYHYHWDYYCWNGYYKHWFFYDSCTNGYYYYCRSHNCYFPVECGCSTCLAMADDESVPPCDEAEDECCCRGDGCDGCSDRGCDGCAYWYEEEESCGCEQCSKRWRAIVEIEEDE
jgi:hypothetical protein